MSTQPKNNNDPHPLLGVAAFFAPAVVVSTWPVSGVVLASAGGAAAGLYCTWKAAKLLGRGVKGTAKLFTRKRRPPVLTKLPDPPTREELAEQARTRFEATLRLLANATLDQLELNAAREQAKQKYLRELEQAM